MEIIANGESRTVPPGTTLATFLESLDLASPRVAVEHNGAIVPRERYDAVILSAGDRLEVVTLVGGG
jgi:thiamine biosynthesis protein ThiS